MLLGVLGSHRIGKTTLAQAYAEQTGSKLVTVSVSKMIEEAGYDSSQTFGYDFGTRMEIQEHVLKSMDELFSAHASEPSIADRTPLDTLLYTVAMIGPGTCTAEQAEWLMDYTNRCFDMSNRYFAVMMCLQPGIPLVECGTSARADSAYIEHLNSLALGFVSDPRLTAPHYFLPRHIVDLSARVRALKLAAQKAMALNLEQQALTTIH